MIEIKNTLPKRILLFLCTLIVFLDNKLRWVDRDSYGTAFTRDVDLENGTHLRINHSGSYFIYSSTSFSMGGGGIVETFYQSVTKYHPLLPRTGDVDLVFSKYGGARSSAKHHTNFLAGVFELQSGYLISSSLSSAGHLYLDNASPVTNYIGLYKLWEALVIISSMC